MSILAPSHSTIDNSVPAYIASRPKFLLSPPPPPKHKRALTAAAFKLPQPPTPPHNRRTHKLVPTPRSPLSPRESFLNILDTPSPPTSLKKKRDAGQLLVSELGYNIAIEAFYAPEPLSIPIPAEANKPTDKSTTKPVLLGMNILSRQHTTNTSTSTSLKPTTKNMMPLHPRSNNNDFEPPMPQYLEQRRGSLPTSSSQNRPRSSTKTSSQVEKDINKAHKKRYPLPLPYGAVVQMDQFFGDDRSAEKVSSRMPPAASSAYSRGATPVGPNGQISTGRPYVGADGRIWRDREEELEYAGLLATGDVHRRASDDTTTSLDDEREERHGRRAWAKFGANSRQGTTYDGFHASEKRSRMPQSATSSSSYDDDDDDGQVWSPLVETHTAQHQFPNYVFPASSKSSRASSSTTASRAIPLPARINDFAVPDTKAPSVHHVPKAKEDFLASAFAPIPQQQQQISTRRSDHHHRERERERATRPPTSSQHESRLTARRSSVQGVGRNEIVVPLPSLRPSHHHQHQMQSPSSNQSLRAPDSEKGGKEKSGFLGVFKKK